VNTLLRTLTVAAAAASLLGGAIAAPNTLTVVVGGGSLGEGQIKAIVEPFEKETGVTVIRVKDQITFAQVKLAEEAKTQSIDVMSFSPANGNAGYRAGYIQPINYSLYSKSDLDAINAKSKAPWGIGKFYFTTVIAYSTAKFPDSTSAPRTYQDVWDLKKFPGVRTLESGQAGDEGPWEEALLADGVPIDKLYPIDIDRVFRSLDRIKPSVRRWWTVGSESMQLFGDAQVALGMGLDGRTIALADAGKPVSYTYNQGKINALYWGIPKGAPNPELAQKFIEFAMRPKQQAEMARLTGYAPVNQNAFPLLDVAFAKRLVSYPDNLKQAYFLNPDWYAEKGPDGKTNSQRLVERWNEWILK
jgi:putative spermidine/putrescine transport system substrate-binding protein